MLLCPDEGHRRWRERPEVTCDDKVYRTDSLIYSFQNKKMTFKHKLSLLKENEETQVAAKPREMMKFLR